MFRLQYALFYTFALIIMLFPRPLRHAFFKSIGRLLFKLLKRKREIIYANLDLAYKGKLSQEEKDYIGKRCFENLIIEGLTSIEIYFTPSKKILKGHCLENYEIVEKYNKQGQAVVFVVFHYNNLEYFALQIAQNAPVITIGQESTNPYIHNFIIRSREKHGLRVVPMGGALRTLASDLKKGKNISVIVDQSVNPDAGIIVEMFGEPTMHLKSASFLARKFDAPLIPLCITQKDSYSSCMTFQEAIPFTKTDDAEADIKYLTQAQATILENKILEDPVPWFWCHRRWKNTHREIYNKK
jgi:Kdo2-lipid IVA lauroyltransferase/acyltransferase